MNYDPINPYHIIKTLEEENARLEAELEETKEALAKLKEEKEG